MSRISTTSSTGTLETGRKQPASAVGTRVTVNVQGEELQGTVLFSGQTSFADGDWLGLELDRKAGNTDGTMGGISYFDCDAGYGLLVRPHMAKPLSLDEDSGAGDQRGKLLRSPKQRLKAPSAKKSFGSVFHRDSPLASKSFGSVFHSQNEVEAAGRNGQSSPGGELPEQVLEELRDLKAQNKAAAKDVEELRAENALLQSQAQRSMETMSQMKQELMQTQTEREATTAEIWSLRGEKDSLNAQVAKLTAFEHSAKTLQKQCAKQEAEIANLLKLQLPDADAATRKAIAKERTRKPSLLQDPHLSDFQASIASLQSTASVLHNKLQQDQELDVLRDAVVKLQKENKQLREQADRLPPLREKILELQQQAKDEEREFERLLDEVQKLQDTKSKLLNTETRLQDTQKSLQDTKKSLQEAQKASDGRIQHLESVNKQLVATQENFGSKDKQVQDLLDENRTLKEKVEKLNPYPGKADGLEKDVKSLRAKVAELEEKMKAKDAEVEEKMKVKDTEAKSKDEANKLFKQAVEALQEDNEKAHSQRQELEEKLQASRMSCKELQKKCDAKDRELNELQRVSGKV